MDNFEDEAETTNDDFDYMDESRKGVPLWSPSNIIDDDFDSSDDSLWSSSNETMDDDFDFDVKITDLPPSGKIDSLLVKLAAFRGRPNPLGRDQSGPYAHPKMVDDDFEVEITDLPENERPALSGMAAPLTNVAARFSPQIRRKRVVSLFTLAFVAVLIILVVLEGMPSAWSSALSIFAQPTPTPAMDSSLSDISGPPAITGSGRIIGSSHGSIFIWSKGTGSTQVIPVQDPLGPVPQYCPRNTGKRPDTPPSPSAVGGPPLWISGFDGNGTALTQLKRAKERDMGWYEQITLILQFSYSNVVVLQGANINNNAPLFLDSVPSGQGLTTLLLLDQGDSTISNHTVGDASWIVMNTNVYIPAAGCYSLTAQWAEGSWTVFFAAGK